MKYLGVITLLLAVALFGAGCSSEDDGSGSLRNSGVLQGRVTIGPICPVENPENPCDPSPSIYAAHRVVILAEDSATVVQEVQTDGQGNYQTIIPAGVYFLDYRPHDIGFNPPIPQRAVIEAGKVTVVNLDIDTGIR